MRRVVISGVVLFVLFGAYSFAQAFWFFGEGSDASQDRVYSGIRVVWDGVSFDVGESSSSTVGALLRDSFQNNGKDFVFPPREESLSSNMTVYVESSKEITVFADGGERYYETHGRTVREVLEENHERLGEYDDVTPSLDTTISGNDSIVITRVSTEEIVLNEDIPFETVEKNDDDLSFTVKKVQQEGVPGIRKITHTVLYHDGEEIDREVVTEEVILEPTDEVVVQGTKVKTGKKHTGVASWYAWTGTMAAANPWLPKGSYVKVTNTANGKSVVVVINDRGPFVPGRIIDLDLVAFKEIASPGAGVINVIMEEVIE